MLTDNRFNTYLVLIFSELNKSQFYKIAYRESPRHESEILMSLSDMNLFKPNEDKKDYHIRKPTMKTSNSNLKIKNIFMWEEK